jgi:hypothetical protein
MENMKDISLKLDENEHLINLLNRNPEILDKVSKFRVAVNRLESNQNKLVDLNSKLGKDTTDAENDKNDRRKGLIEVALPVILILQVFAHDRKKENLQRRLYFLTPENVQNSSDTELIETSKKIWLIANKYGRFSLSFANKIKSLLDPNNSKDTIKFEKEYGLSPEMFRNFEEAILRFIETSLLYEGEMAKKEKVAIKIKKINKLTKKLISNKIDRFAILFENENPEFYHEYCGIRGNHLKKQIKESLDQESDPIVLAEELPKSPAKPKRKPKSPKN